MERLLSAVSPQVRRQVGRLGERLAAGAAPVRLLPGVSPQVSLQSRRPGVRLAAEPTQVRLDETGVQLRRGGQLSRRRGELSLLRESRSFEDLLVLRVVVVVGELAEFGVCLLEGRDLGFVVDRVRLRGEGPVVVVCGEVGEMRGLGRMRCGVGHAVVLEVGHCLVVRRCVGWDA